MLLPESQTEGEAVNEALQEPPHGVYAGVRLLLLQLGVQLCQLRHQDLTKELNDFYHLLVLYFLKKNLKGFQLGKGGKIESFHIYLLHGE